MIDTTFKKIKSILNHFNYSHCGVEILSMSKRIMNEVMTLAEDEGLNIWYQDTDSMHINYEEVELLALAFKSKYNRDLIGEDMSQFHIDFDLDGACGEIYSTESYFLAKRFTLINWKVLIKTTMLLQVIILDLRVFLHHVSIIHPKTWKCHQWIYTNILTVMEKSYYLI